MATLHVRNVPDDLYEQLREAAAEDGRSIGAQATALLRDSLAARGVRCRGVDRLVLHGASFKQHFAAHVRQLVLRGQELALERGAPEVAPAHVLLAMLEDPILRPSLERGGVTLESVNAALPPAREPSRARPPVSPDARRMLENALVATLD